MPPSAAWANTSTTAAIAGRKICFTRRYCRQATAAWAPISTTTSVAKNRCEYSISAWYCSGGIHRPNHVGQTGHPRPEFVARTSPPTATSRTVEVVVAIESFWKRVIRGRRRRRTRQPSSTGWSGGDDGCHTAVVVVPAEPEVLAPVLQEVRARVDPVLLRFLADRRAELAGLDPSAAVLVDELLRLLRAGGKRLRPALCWWAFVAAGGSDGEPIRRACAALELLHTSALVHDDVMDGAVRRRGVPSTHVRFAGEAPPDVDPEAFGVAAAIVVGDLALALSDQALRSSGFSGHALARASIRFDRIRLEMAAGQLMDVGGSADPTRVRALKSGSYTAVGPVLIGTALAEADRAVESPLGVYARLVGEAFQLRDDVLDGDAHPGDAGEVGTLLGRALLALEDAPVRPQGRTALVELAGLLRLTEEA